METGRYRCPRCAEYFGTSDPSENCDEPVAVTSVDGAAAMAAGPTAVEPDLPPYDGWELEEDLRHVERLLSGRKLSASEKRVRVDASHAPSTQHTPPNPQRKKQRTSDSESAGSALLWPLLAIGLMTFVCGWVLVGWSFVSGRAELWDFGLPTALLGQLALLAGLVLQLERMWSDSRDTATKLEHVDDELHDLRSTATLLGTSQSTAGNSFYAHLAGGAGPQLLLADLKSQLDLLAVKISRDDG